MARTPKLTDIQLILLTTACQRDDGSLLPPPDSIGDPADRIRKAVAALLKRDLAEEVEMPDPTRCWREEGDHHIGVRITDAGRVAIGVEVPLKEGATADVDPPSEPPAPQILARAGTKQALLIKMLQRKQGASISDLATATGWLPHTTRAALTGLRKKGHVLTSDKRDGVSHYRIGA